MYAAGTVIQGESASEDRLVPSLRKITHNNHTPELNSADFVAPNATILGNVRVGEKSSVWFNATILGTLSITIGRWWLM